MKKVLITAYDVDPYKGSESSTGWNYPLHISKYHHVTVVTRNNNIPNIRRYIVENKIDSSRLEFIGLDLPSWSMFWKNKTRGAFLYYYLWQIFVACSLYSKRHSFDVCHALNFHCDWAPSFLWLLGKPFVWGPINHNEPLPDYMTRNYSITKKINENFKNTIKFLFWNLDPFLYVCKKRATKILVGHTNVIRRLNLSEDKCILFNQISTDISETMPVQVGGYKDVFSVLFVGRGLPIKNYLSVVQAFIAAFGDDIQIRDRVELSLVGVGKEGKYQINELLNDLNYNINIQIIEWVDFSEIHKFYESSNVFCFPSFEGAGMVIAEALANSLPVITIDANGASHELNESVAFVVSSESYSSILDGLKISLQRLAKDKKLLDRMSNNSYHFAKENLSWSIKSKNISLIYDSIFEVGYE